MGIRLKRRGHLERRELQISAKHSGRARTIVSGALQLTNHFPVVTAHGVAEHRDSRANRLLENVFGIHHLARKFVGIQAQHILMRNRVGSDFQTFRH